MRRTCMLAAVTLLLALAAGTAAWATAATTLDDALRGGHDVFLVVTEPQAPGVEGARDLATKAAALASGTVIVEMDRANAENAPLVARFRLAAAPVPLILVVAKNGIPAGGALPARTTPDQLASMVPTPKKAEYLKALAEGRSAILVLGRPDMAGLEQVTKVCEAARARLNQDAQANVQVGQSMPKDQASVIPVTLTDPVERRFLTEMKANMTTNVPVVIVVNVKGQTTATMEPPGITVESIVAATKKRVAECCPGGKCG